MEKVEHLIGEYQRDGLAVAGVPQTLAALYVPDRGGKLIGLSAATQFDKAEVERSCIYTRPW